MKLFKYLLILIISVSTASSQVWLEPFLDRDSVKLSEIQVVAEAYFETIDISQKGSGFKQYKRFEQFWKDRLMPDGTFPDAGLLLREKLKFNQSINNKNNKVQASDSWQVLGPFESNGGYGGLARVNCVRKNPHNGAIWAGLPAGGIWVSTNEGTTWSTNTDNEDVITALGITSIAFHPTNSSLVYAASGDGDGTNTYSLGVLKSTDGGSNWKTTGLSWNVTQYRTISKLLINPTSPDILYTAGSNGIYKSTDAGNTWDQLKTGNFKDMEFKPGTPNTIYASGTELWRSTDAGANWTQLTNGFPTSGIRRIALAVSVNNANALYALVGNSSGNNLKGVYLSTNSGDSFTEIADNSPNMMGYAKAGDDTKGQVWYDLCIEADQDDWESVIVGGVNLWRTTDKGANWEISSMWSGNHNDVTTVHADQHDLWYDNTNNIMYVGNDGGVYKSSDFGDNWDWIGSGILGTQFYRFGISQLDSSVYIGGTQDNGTKVHKSNGTWRDAIGGDGFESLVDNEDKNTMYGSLYYGAFFKSTNSGNNFKRLNDLDNNNEYDEITESGAWSTPFIQNPSNSNTILLGMNNVWISKDKGDHFTKISNFGFGNNKLVSLAMSESDSNYIYASFSSKLYRTTNYGTSWTEMTRPGNSGISYIFVDDEDSDKLWATNSGYSASNKVFESTDGGTTWTNLTKNLPNVPALTIVKQKDSDDRLWIGNDIGVYYIDDNLTDWVAYNTDLPNVIVTELEINYTHNQLYAATYGRGIWKADIPSTLSVPSIIEPLANSFGNATTNLLIDWTDVPEATEYEIQVSTDLNFSTTIAIDTVTVSRYFLNNLSNFTNYYAKIRAKSKYSISNWTQSQKFTTIVGKVSLISPTNNSIAKDTADNLSWSVVQGKTEYQVQIANDENFNNLVVDQNITAEQFNYNSLSHFTYYWWKVRAKDPSNIYGDWSFVRKYQTKVNKPDLISPANSTTDLAFTQNLDWSEVTGADKYIIQLSDKSDFSNLILNKSVNITQESISNLLPYTKYYWRAAAENNTKQGNWSNVFTFTTKIEAATLISPANNAFNLDTFQTFNWNNVPYADNYEIQIDTKNTFDTPNLIISNISQNSREVDKLLHDTLYYWKIRIKVNSEIGAWSDIWTFRTKLKEPTLELPTNNTTNVNFSDILEWFDSAPTSSYKLQIALSSNFNSLVVDEIVNDNNYDFDGLEDYKVYYWRTKAVRGEYQSDWSDIFSFTTKIGTTSLINPSDNSVNQDTNIVFSWNKKDYANKYTIQISLENSFTNPKLITSSVNNNYNGLNLLYDTTYYWRTKVHLSNDEGDWSDIFSFRTKLEKPNLISPILGSTEIATKGQLQWNNLASNSQSRIQISLASDFVNPSKNELVNNETFNYSNLQNDKKYYWRVKSVRGQFESDWSSTFDFNTPSTIDRPQLNYPSNNESNLEIAALNLKWIALSNVTNYRIQISMTDNFQSPIIDKSDVNLNNFDFSQLEYNKLYYWRVKGIRTGGNESEWSETWVFSTILPTPKLELPLNLSNDVDLVSKLVWESIDEATKYNVELATDNQFISKIIEPTKSVNTNSLDLSGLDENKTYFWRVNSESGIALSNWSEIWSFTTSKPISYVTSFDMIGTIKITPNPVTDIATIDLQLIKSSAVNIYISDMNGKFMKSIVSKYYLENQRHQISFNKGMLSSGVYFINFDIDGITKSIKIIVN